MASDLSAAALGGPLLRQGRHFQDSQGRTILPRGVSLSGISKLALRTTDDGDGGQSVSWVGRPFPIGEASLHFERLKLWGLTLVRLVVVWEALEPNNPGVYDEEYIDYLVKLITLMPQYGIKCFIDPHQDVYSRSCGGSGAPSWTLSIVGFNLAHLRSTGAVIPTESSGEEARARGDAKIWPSGYNKLAAATMATLFWAGGTFAPLRKVRPDLHSVWREDKGRKDEMISTETFLQESMIAAFARLARSIKGLEAVIGIEIINEPHRGYIELLSPFSWDYTTDLAISHFPSTLQGFALGSGYPTLVDNYAEKFPHPVTTKVGQTMLIPPGGVSAWKEEAEGGKGCVWKEAGVWKWKEKAREAVMLRCDYFNRHPETGAEVEWYRDFYWPFCKRFGQAMNEIDSSWATFVGPIPNEFLPHYPAEAQPPNLIYTPHWYDLHSLFSQKTGWIAFDVQALSRGAMVWTGIYSGRNGLKKNYAKQLKNIIEWGYKSAGEVVTIIGETGIPFDTNSRKAFGSGDYYWQERQLDAVCAAMEGNLVGFNLWNYNPLNTNAVGDSWEREDFSIYSLSAPPPALPISTSPSDAALNVGARGLNAFERAYAAKIAGIPLETSYDMETLRFKIRFINPTPPSSLISPPLSPTQIAAEYASPLGKEWPATPTAGNPVRSRFTEIHLPRRLYGVPSSNGLLRVKVGGGEVGEWRYDLSNQTLYFSHDRTEAGFIHSLEISIEGRERTERNWYIVVAILLAMIAFSLDLLQG